MRPGEEVDAEVGRGDINVGVSWSREGWLYIPE